MKTLHLNLKKKWFDMILSGEKTEEYREIKPYWEKRLFHKLYPKIMQFRDYDYVVFSNGYSKTARKMKFKVSEITAGFGKEEWGAEPEKSYFIIKLGECVGVGAFAFK